MAVLLLRLAGPLQSWGVSSRFSYREAGREPSKSGVVGLLCAALGVPRDDDAAVAELAALPLAVRVDREGLLGTDFQTIGGGTVRGAPYGVARANDSRGGTVLSVREVLQDASFLVGLEGEAALLHRLDRALRDPRWPLYLGRRAHVPGVPVAAGVVAGPLETALQDGAPPGLLRLVCEVEDGAGEPRFDVPVSFHPQRRAFRLRYVTTVWRGDDGPARTIGAIPPLP